MVAFSTLVEKDWFEFNGTMFYVRNATAKGKTFNAVSADGDAWEFDPTDMVTKV